MIDHLGSAVADEDQGQHVDAGGVEPGEADDLQLLARAAQIAGEDHRGLGRARLEEDVPGGAELVPPALGGRVVEDGDEIAGRGGLEPPLDLGPGS